MTVAEAIAAFTKNPSKFMVQNYVVIAGGTTRNPGPTIFRMLEGNKVVKGRSTFWGRLKIRKAWTIQISNNNGGTPSSTAALAADEFVAFYVPMKQQSDSVGVVFGQPPTDGSLDLLLTSQLTGCTFAFSSATGQFLAAHLQPIKGTAPATNRQNMATIMQANMNHGARLVQKGVDYTDTATIVGKFDGAAWKMCMQRNDFNENGGNDGFLEIKGITVL